MHRRIQELAREHGLRNKDIKIDQHAAAGQTWFVARIGLMRGEPSLTLEEAIASVAKEYLRWFHETDPVTCPHCEEEFYP